MHDEIKSAVAAETARCVAVLKARAAALDDKSHAQNATDTSGLIARADECRYLAAMLQCSCGKGIETAEANHGDDCPVRRQWVEQQSFQEGSFGT